MNARPAARRPVYHEWRHPERRFRFPALAAALIVLALPAAAQEAPREGEIEFTFSADVEDLSKIAGGGDREVSAFEANLVITETVAGPMERMGARCVGWGDFDARTLASQGRGSCVWQDAEGDQIFENMEDSGAGGTVNGRATILGGTGKFAGMTGGYDYTLEFVASPREGLTQWVGHKKGHWRIATD
jgi:hypothetical protein